MPSPRNCADLKVASYILIHIDLAKKHFSPSDVKLMKIGFQNLLLLNVLSIEKLDRIVGKICYIDDNDKKEPMTMIVKDHVISNVLVDNANAKYVALLFYKVTSYTDQVSGAEPVYKKDFVPHINNNCYDVGIGMTRSDGYAMKSAPGEVPLMYTCGKVSKTLGNMNTNTMFLCPLVTETFGLDNGNYTCEYMKRVVMDFKLHNMEYKLVGPRIKSDCGFNRTIMFFSNEKNRKDFHFYLLMRPPREESKNENEKFLAHIGITVPFFYHKAGWSNHMGIVDKTGALMVNPREQCRGVPDGISYEMACDNDITYKPKPNNKTSNSKHTNTHKP